MPVEEVRDYAAKLAKEIDDGDGPSFVLWSSKNKIQVVMGRASPPENLPESMSLEQWRKHLKPAIAEELSTLGWEIKEGNRFWRQGTIEEKRSREVSIASQKRKNNVLLVVFAVAIVFMLLSALIDSKPNKRKIYYDMIKTQDENPDSPAWDQGVKEAAADYYDMPMSEINDIVREGATEGWLQPDPP